MAEGHQEAEVSAVEYAGSHPVRPDRYAIILTLKTTAGAPETRLSLLFRAPEANFLANMLQRNPPRIEAEQDHVLTEIDRLQT